MNFLNDEIDVWTASDIYLLVTLIAIAMILASYWSNFHELGFFSAERENSIRFKLRMRILILILIILLITLVRNSEHQQYDPVHTWHTVISLNGTWYGTLHVMTENEHGIYFVDGSTNHSVIQNPFIVSESSFFEYGLVISKEDDFNMLYSLTLNQQLKPDPTKSNSRICVYLIAARRAADPQIVPVSFNGNTTCLWQTVQGRGENFWVT